MNDMNIAPYEFTAEGKGPHLLISAGVHGDEYEPILAARELIGKIASLLVAGKVTVVPVVNISAYESGTRYGADGLDLARICPGNKNGSVSENFAAQISSLINTADFYIDMHTGGNIFEIYPLAGYMLHPLASILKQQQQMAEAFNLPVIWGTNSTPNGRTLSAARDAGIPALYVEYGGGGSVQKKIVKAYTEGCLNVLKYLKMINSREKISPVKKYWLEDDVPDSGHLQSKMPAPVDGIFVPAVKLGQKIGKKQLWGTITDPLSGDTTEIFAKGSGLVFFLRRFPYVRSGDSLGGILPVSKPGKKIITAL